MRKKLMLSELELQAVLLMFPLDTLANLSCEHLARALGVSRSHLSRCFSNEDGDNLEKMLQKTRILRGALALSDHPGLSVKDAARKVGYEDAKHFSRLFKVILGIYPKEYKRFLEVCRYSGV